MINLPPSQIPQANDLWQSISLVILVIAVLVTTLLLWRRFFSRRMLVRQIAELEALSAAGKAIVASELDVTALSRLIAEEAKKIIGIHTIQVGLFDNNRYRIMYWTLDDLEQDVPQSFDMGDSPSLIKWVKKSQKPLLVKDFDREMDKLPAKPSYISQTPPRSALFIPLVSGEITLGIVAAQSSQPNRFSEEDLRRLMILANQSAAAIANARLFERERMRAAHLELVGKIAMQVNAVQDLDQIFSQVVNLTQEIFDFFPVNIFSIDQTTGDAVLQASSDQSVSNYGGRLKSMQGLVGTAAANRRTIVSNNTLTDERFISHLDGHSDRLIPNTCAEIAIPLLVDDQTLGVLDVQSSQANVFTDVEQMALEALAAEVASAIHKAQQLAWQQEQAWLTTAQLQIAEAISRSSDLDEIVYSISRLTPMLSGVKKCFIFLWDAELEIYRAGNFYDAFSGEGKVNSDLSLAIGDWHALDAVHVGRQSLITSRIPVWLQPFVNSDQESTTEIQLIPLMVTDHIQPQGVMIVDQPKPIPSPLHANDPTRRQMVLLRNIAQQAAQGIERARLREAQEEEAWVNTALLQVAEAVNSLVDLNEILNTIVRLVPILVGVKSAIILIRDDQRKLFLPGPSYGISGMGRGVLATLEIDDNEFRSMTANTSDTRLVSDFATMIRLPGWLKTVLESPEAHVFQLIAQGRLVGVLMVGMSIDSKKPLTSRRLNILNGIAQQAATAVVNNQLYKESAERVRMQQELNVARDIQASFLPRGNPEIPGCDVASLWLAARQVSGDFYDFLPRADGTWGIVVADVADKGVPAALFMAVSRTILRTVGFNRKDPAEVLMRVNEIISIDAQSDLFVTVFYAVWDPKTRTITFANGGHNPPLLISRKGHPQLLKVPGIALGVIPQIFLKSKTISLKQDDLVILYTDGVTEAINEDYDEYGLERLQLAAQIERKKSAHEILQAIRKSVQEHAGETPQSDDVTLVVMKRT